MHMQAWLQEPLRDRQRQLVPHVAQGLQQQGHAIQGWRSEMH